MCRKRLNKKLPLVFHHGADHTRLSFWLGGGRVVRWCWVNFQCRGVLLIWIIVGQGPTAIAVGAGGDCLDIFSLECHFSFLTPSLWETARYRLKNCLKGPLSPTQPTNKSFWSLASFRVILERLLHAPGLGYVADGAHFITGYELTLINRIIWCIPSADEF